ncbi:MAG TPA: serine hydrolase [Candidatus Saccharimonadales bacterium]|nr:serine hydrolase [Candidatus Saccharimonadales bacterium]
MKRRFLLFTTLFFMALSILLGVLYYQSSTKNESTKYPHLAKRLFLEDPNDVLINLEPLRQNVRKYLTDTGLTYSFYFEYLFTGSNIRAGDSNKLVGASLMKIPVVMDLYKAAEQNKIDINKKVTVDKESVNNDTEFGNQQHLKPGDQISLRDAARIALTESDNTAAYIVFQATQHLLAPEDQAINNLDVETQIGESDKGKYALIGARSYSSFLKCLYYSCFLSRDHSEQILSDLSKTTDTTRIRAGVSKDTEVIHKIGSFSNVTQSDCGIVYLTNRRYILCIMLDTDAQTANKHIQKIAEMTNDYVAKANLTTRQPNN